MQITRSGWRSNLGNDLLSISCRFTNRFDAGKTVASGFRCHYFRAMSLRALHSATVCKYCKFPGVARLVSFSGQPAPLREEDVHALENCLRHGNQVQPYPYLQAGRRARVKSGPLQGLEGIVLRQKNRTRFIVSIDLIMRSMAVDIETDALEQAG